MTEEKCKQGKDCICESCRQVAWLEQENKELKEEIKKYSAINEQDTKDYAILSNALEEIREDIKCFYSFEDSSSGYQLVTIIDRINEVLGNENN